MVTAILMDVREKETDVFPAVKNLLSVSKPSLEVFPLYNTILKSRVKYICIDSCIEAEKCSRPRLGCSNEQTPDFS